MMMIQLCATPLGRIIKNENDDNNENNNIEIEPMQHIDIDAEYDVLMNVCRSHDIKLTQIFLSNIENISIELEPCIVHFSGHGCAQGIWIERPSGDAVLCSSDDFAKLLQRLQVDISVLFVCACHSEDFATQLLQKTDIPVIIAIRSNERIADDISRALVRVFYAGLFENLPVTVAFQRAIQFIKNLPSLDDERKQRQEEKFLFLGRVDVSSASSDENQSSFQTSLQFEAALDFARVQAVSPSKIFGREKDLIRSLQAVQNHQFLCLSGPRGIGKTALLQEMVSFLQTRNQTVVLHHIGDPVLESLRRISCCNDTLSVIHIICIEGIDRIISSIDSTSELVSLMDVLRKQGGLIVTTAIDSSSIYGLLPYPRSCFQQLAPLDQGSVGLLASFLKRHGQYTDNASYAGIKERAMGNPAGVRCWCHDGVESSLRFRNDLPWELLNISSPSSFINSIKRVDVSNFQNTPHLWAVIEELIGKYAFLFCSKLSIRRVFSLGDLLRIREVLWSTRDPIQMRWEKLWKWVETALSTICYFRAVWDEECTSLRLIYGLISKLDVEQTLLQDALDQSFVIRLSESSPQCLAMAMKIQQRVYHVLIHRKAGTATEAGSVEIDGQQHASLNSFLLNYARVRFLWTGVDKMYII